MSGQQYSKQKRFTSPLQVLERSGGWSGGGAEPGLVLQIRPRDARLQPRPLLPGAGGGDLE